MHQLNFSIFSDLCRCCVFVENNLLFVIAWVWRFPWNPLANNTIRYNPILVLEASFVDKRWAVGDLSNLLEAWLFKWKTEREWIQIKSKVRRNQIEGIERKQTIIQRHYVRNESTFNKRGQREREIYNYV